MINILFEVEVTQKFDHGDLKHVIYEMYHFNESTSWNRLLWSISSIEDEQLRCGKKFSNIQRISFDYLIYLDYGEMNEWNTYSASWNGQKYWKWTIINTHPIAKLYTSTTQHITPYTQLLFYLYLVLPNKLRKKTMLFRQTTKYTRMYYFISSFHHWTLTSQLSEWSGLDQRFTSFATLKCHNWSQRFPNRFFPLKVNFVFKGMQNK